MKKNNKHQGMFSWMNPKLEVKKTDKYGKGVFAVKNIKKDELLAIFGGYILTLKEEEKLLGEFSDTGMQIHDNFVLTSKNSKENTDYFNHSCDPNSGFKGQIFLVAMRDIKKGEEITFDYAMVLCSNKDAKLYKIKCLCGRKNCRGFITEEDWKIPKLQKKYNGYFQYFLQNKIK
jgi:SET domain-containing protein